jgi:hypothetical protein
MTKAHLTFGSGELIKGGAYYFLSVVKSKKKIMASTITS